MATREENLKTINNKLEQLSDEELERVAGGASDDLGEQSTDNISEKYGSKPANLFISANPDNPPITLNQNQYSTKTADLFISANPDNPPATFKQPLGGDKIL